MLFGPQRGQMFKTSQIKNCRLSVGAQCLSKGRKCLAPMERIRLSGHVGLQTFRPLWDGKPNLFCKPQKRDSRTLFLPTRSCVGAVAYITTPKARQDFLRNA